MVGYIWGRPSLTRIFKKILSVDGIKSYNGLGDGSVFAKGFCVYIGLQFWGRKRLQQASIRDQFRVFQLFTRKAFRLVEGGTSKRTTTMLF